MNFIVVYHCHHHHHHYYHHISVMQLGHLLTRSGLTYPKVSSNVCHDSFCQLGNSVSLRLGNLLRGILFTCWIQPSSELYITVNQCLISR